MMSDAYMMGKVVGLAIGFALVFILIRLVLKKGDTKPKYDERQQISRGKGYMYGFFSLLIGLALMICFSEELQKYIEIGLLCFIIMCFAICVFAGYCVFHEAYIAVNEQPKKVIVLFLLMAVANIAGGVMQIARGHAIENGRLSINSINLFCGILMLVVAIEVVIKQLVVRTEEE